MLDERLLRDVLGRWPSVVHRPAIWPSVPRGPGGPAELLDRASTDRPCRRARTSAASPQQAQRPPHAPSSATMRSSDDITKSVSRTTLAAGCPRGHVRSGACRRAPRGKRASSSAASSAVTVAHRRRSPRADVRPPRDRRGLPSSVLVAGREEPGQAPREAEQAAAEGLQRSTNSRPARASAGSALPPGGAKPHRRHVRPRADLVEGDSTGEDAEVVRQITPRPPPCGHRQSSRLGPGIAHLPHERDDRTSGRIRQVREQRPARPPDDRRARTHPRRAQRRGRAQRRRPSQPGDVLAVHHGEAGAGRGVEQGDQRGGAARSPSETLPGKTPTSVTTNEAVHLPSGLGQERSALGLHDCRGGAENAPKESACKPAETASSRAWRDQERFDVRTRQDQHEPAGYFRSGPHLPIEAIVETPLLHVPARASPNDP